MQKIYEIADHGIDGRHVTVIGYTTDEETARTINERINGRCSFVNEKPLYSSVEDYEENNPNARRQKALNKLNDDDKRALGLA